MMDREYTFCNHANDEEIMEYWKGAPLEIETLGIDGFHDDIHNVMTTNNVFDAFTHYWTKSQVSAIMTGETNTERVWVMYKGYIALFAVFSCSSPEDSPRLIFDVRSHFDTKVFDGAN